MDLIVDCSRKGVNLGLYAGDACFELSKPEAKGDELKSLLEKLLAENSLELSQIKRVLVTLGPGSFTGIRAGIAFCEGLCFSGKRTLHGISTLKGLAMAHGKEIILHSRADFYYVGNAESETVKQFENKPETHEYLPITPLSKLIDAIPPSRVQRANYLVNPYAAS